MVRFGKEIKLGGKGDKEKGIHSKEERELNNIIQRIQQHVNSLEKRLDAVERRLSNEPFEGTKFSSKSVAIEKNYEDKLKEITRNLGEEIKILKKDIEVIKAKGITKAEGPVTISLKRSGENITNFAREIANIERRLERLEKKKATATVKVGKIEVPIEITGIVGGFLAFIIAILLFGGYKNLVISPPFVMFIGLVLLTATALKTYLINVSRR